MKQKTQLLNRTNRDDKRQYINNITTIHQQVNHILKAIYRYIVVQSYTVNISKSCYVVTYITEIIFYNIPRSNLTI